VGKGVVVGKGVLAGKGVPAGKSVLVGRRVAVAVGDGADRVGTAVAVGWKDNEEVAVQAATSKRAHINVTVLSLSMKFVSRSPARFIVFSLA
jgi:hypothetical protein